MADVETKEEPVAAADAAAAPGDAASGEGEEGAGVEEEEEEEEEEEGIPPLPVGCEPMMIEDMNAEKYGLKTGPKIKDTVKYKLLAYDFVKEDLKWGINSSFHFVKGVDGVERSWVAAYPEGEEFLVVADVDDVYGEGWILATTPEGKEAMLDIVLAEERALQAIEDERLAQVAAAEAAEAAIRNAVYEEVDMLVRPYKSESAEETGLEVDLFTESVGRPRIVHRLARRRRFFGAPMAFADDDAEHSGVKEFRQHKDPNFDLQMAVHDTGLQVGPVMRLKRSVETQTSQQRTVNRSTQYEPMSLANARVDAICEQPKFLDFIEDACYACEVALQQNETMDVFQMELKPETGGSGGGGDGDGDVLGGQAAESDVTKLRSLTHLLYSKGKNIPCIDWHPRKTGTVVACAEDNIKFNERSELAGTARKAHSLVWRMKDLDPYIVLESPFECTAIKYNPHRPSLIVGGLNTGQVVLWDTEQREKELEFERLNSHVGGVGEDGPGSKDGKDRKPLPELDLSSIDASHNRPVQQLEWLPESMEFTARGELRYTDDKAIHQFATIATDGRLHIWDVRFREGKKNSHRSKKPAGANGKAEIEESTWAPLCSVLITGETGAAAVGVRRVLFPKVDAVVGDAAGKKVPLCYFGTDSGHLACVDIATAATAHVTDDEKGVRWVRKDHFRPARTLQRSPFFEDVLVSVGDWDFNIWKEGHEAPLFTSTMSSTYLRCARWSPTRPGLLFVARFDGVIDVWDFTDQSHRPATEIVVGLSPISTMEFWTSAGAPDKRTVLLAVTDLTGALHVLQLSKQLSRPVTNELALIASYFDRELAHREYVQQRASGGGVGGVASDGGGGGGGDGELAKQAPDKTPLQEEQAQEEAYKAIEEHYRELFGV